jgi:hypothetical protein
MLDVCVAMPCARASYPRPFYLRMFMYRNAIRPPRIEQARRIGWNALGDFSIRLHYTQGNGGKRFIERLAGNRCIIT